MTLEAKPEGGLRAPPQVFDFCPVCGKPVIEENGVKICKKCGEVVL